MSKIKVMLSYQWDSQLEVIRIKEELIKRGYEVWMDLEQIKGNIYERMAQGVEESSVIIACMTGRYEVSESCKRELFYAKDNRKKIVPIKLEKEYNPRGALGLIVAGTLYIDFAGTNTFFENMNALEGEILDGLQQTLEPISTKRFYWHESTAIDGDYIIAAENLITALYKKGVKRNQVVSIDADDNQYGLAIFVAFYYKCGNDEDEEELKLYYDCERGVYPWELFYKNVYKKIPKNLDPRDIISFTGCGNPKENAVFYAFYQQNNEVRSTDFNYIETSSSMSWNRAADALINQLKNCDVRKGQLISIDAHTGEKSVVDAVFSAFWDTTLMPCGPLSISYEEFRCSNETEWHLLYDNVTSFCERLDKNNIISITGSVRGFYFNTRGMYVFYYK